MLDLRAVFAELKSVMAPYAVQLDTKQNDDVMLYVDTKVVQKNKKPMYFGAVMLKKSYVSYHLMPVYMQPELLATLSPGLRRRMQGKSCFNFTEIDELLFKELDALTNAGLQSYKGQGLA